MWFTLFSGSIVGPDRTSRTRFFILSGNNYFHGSFLRPMVRTKARPAITPCNYLGRAGCRFFHSKRAVDREPRRSSRSRDGEL
jgi:hypothetical protein